ncbi:MAG: zinc-dependent metalloprotease, partial [Myxococcales bacterium]|nr:zinc-dependent metalloprotease [Myxococcales bacterium]
LAAPLAAWAAPVRSAPVPRAFLDGTFYFSVATEGGNEVDGSIAGVSQLERVRFVFEDRFLVVELAEDTYSNPDDPSLRAVVARFPYTARGEAVDVAWGDDPSPFVTQVSTRTRRGTQVVRYTAAGAHDVAGFEVDAARGLLTFVKHLSATGDNGDRKDYRVRYNFLKQAPTEFQPKKFKASDAKNFGFFATSTDALTDPETGHLEEKSFLMRIDASKTFTYELHPTVPEVCRKPITEAILSWNDVFEARTGKRPLAVVDGAVDHMPGDLRYHVVYFRTRGYREGGYSAYGPPVAIAHTGEVVDADVIVDGTRLMGEYQKLKAAEAKRLSAAEEEAEKAKPAATAALPSEPKTEVVQFLLNRVALGSGPAAPDHFPSVRDVLERIREEGEAKKEPVPADEAFYYLVRGLMTHEVGHNLGLRHNFAASTDAAHIPEGTVSTSIMDYTELHAGHHGPKAYDAAAIAFGYEGDLKPSEVGTLRFMTDHHAETEPMANRHDLGDPFTYYTRVIEKVCMAAIRKGAKPAYPV